MTVPQDNQSIDTIDALERTLEEMQHRLVAARSRCAELESGCQHLVSAITTLKNEAYEGDAGEVIAPVDLQGCVEQPEMYRSAPESTHSDDTPATVDLSRCMNLRERLERIAIANNGLLGIGHAAAVILAAGASRSTPRNLRNDITKCVNQYPRDWEHVWTAVYRYKRFITQDDEGP